MSSSHDEDSILLARESYVLENRILYGRQSSPSHLGNVIHFPYISEFVSIHYISKVYSQTIGVTEGKPEKSVGHCEKKIVNEFSFRAWLVIIIIFWVFSLIKAPLMSIVVFMLLVYRLS